MWALEGVAARTALAWVCMLSSSLWVWHVARGTRPGWHRGIATLPALLALHCVPLLFDFQASPLAATAATFLCVRLTAGKVFGFVLGRGALTLDLTPLQFVVVMLAPFMPAELDTLSTPHAEQQQKLVPGDALGGRGGLAEGFSSSWRRATPAQRFSIDSHSRTASPSGTPRGAAAAAAAAASAVATPAQHKGAEQRHQQSRLQRAANVALNASVCAAFVGYSCRSWSALRDVALHLGALGIMWRAMEGIMAVSSLPARDWLGMTLAPHFANPYRASSLTDFWARRWNITQGLVLRFYVYEPIVQGRLVAAPTTAAATAAAVDTAAASADSSSTAPAASNGSSALAQRRQPSRLSGLASSGSTGSLDSDSPQPSTAAAAPTPPATPLLAGPSAAVAPRWRRQLAAAATFVVSGLEHELFLWYLLGTWGWRWLLFFSLQGLLLAVEAQVKRAGRATGLSLHPVCCSLAVLLVLGVTADGCFWPPLVQPALVQPLAAAVAPWMQQLCAATAGWLPLVSTLDCSSVS